MNSTKKATLTFTDGTPSVEFPIYEGSVGPDVIDIRKLYGQTGKFTFDPGFMSTAACDSKITYIDGDKGELLYRGYPIEQLATNCGYLETCYLLLNGELPNRAQQKDFEHRVTHHFPWRGAQGKRGLPLRVWNGEQHLTAYARNKRQHHDRQHESGCQQAGPVGWSAEQRDGRSEWREHGHHGAAQERDEYEHAPQSVHHRRNGGEQIDQK